MRIPLPKHSTWTLALVFLLGLALTLGLTALVSAQGGPAPAAVGGPTGTTINVTTTDDELNSDGDCSLREALQAANTDAAVDACPAGSDWDIINIRAGTYVLTKVGAGENANATGDLDILDSVTIVGAGAGTTVIDGNAADRIFHVDPTTLGVALDLQAVTVKNGASAEGAGLLSSDGFTRIEDSVFTENKATGSGGAIQADLGTLHIMTSTIQYNDAGPSGDGGGIYVDVVALTVQGSRIYSNTAQEGGGLYNNYGSMTIRDTQVVSNVAGPDFGYGGGIHSLAGNLIVEAGSEIDYNRAETTGSYAYGGGIYAADETQLIILDSFVRNNRSDREGGGVYFHGYGGYVRNSAIDLNSSIGAGGGFWAYGDVSFIDSQIVDNHSDDASEGGGGIYAYGEYASIIISNTLVMSNTTDGHGAGLYISEYGGVFVDNSIFRVNNAQEYGGGIYLYEYGGLIVEDSSFEDNEAEYGGAIYAYYENPLTVDRSTFSRNRADQDGGAFYLEEEIVADIRNSTFSQNWAGDEGGAIYNYDADYSFGVQSSTIVSNTARTSAGGIYSEGYFAAQNSIIAGNIASSDSSTNDCYVDIDFTSGGHNLLGKNTGCDSTRYDQEVATGALFVSVLGPLADNGGVTLPDGSHPKTHALLNNSPAIDAANDDFCPKVDERGVSRPKGNACDVGAYESDFSAAAPSFTHNVISVNTSNDELNNDNDCSLREAVEAANTDTAVDECKAGDGWDTISLPAGTYSLTLSAASEDANATGDLDIITQTVTLRGAGAGTTTIDGNKSDRVFDVLARGTLLLEDVTITNGSTIGKGSYNGGCIQSDIGLLALLDVAVSECSAPDYGGGIYLYSGVGRLVNTIVRENTSLDENGGIYNYQGTLSIESSQIISNTAEDYGGGVMSYYGVTRLSASIVQGNVLTDTDNGGGGIHHQTGTLIVDEDSKVMYNETKDEGGGIHGYYGAVKIENSTISHNKATAGGGGYGGYYGGLWVRSSLFEHNSTEGDGGGVYYTGGLIENSTIRYNEAISDTSSGGGLNGWPVLVDSVVFDNKAASGGGIHADGIGLFGTVVHSNTARTGEGGGIYIQSSTEYGGVALFDSAILDNKTMSGTQGAGIYAGTMPVTARGSTFSGNAGTGQGGAIYNEQSVVDLVNSTVSGNSAQQGAGIYVLSGTVSLNFSTVADNAAGGDGGGLYNKKATAVLNSIVAGNRANGSPTDASADCQAMTPIAYAGYSLFGDSTGCAAEGRGDQTVAPATVFTAVLAPLADNGGPAMGNGDSTQTHALLYGSPALDAIASGTNGCYTEVDADQRGVSRPQGVECDIGAFEAQSYQLDVSKTGAGSGTVSGTGIACGSTCSETYPESAVVTLSASAGTQSTFGGWSGACTNSSGDCVVTMDQAKQVSAAFDAEGYKVFLPYISR